MRTDFENLTDGQRIKLFPLPDNPIQKEPGLATYASGYFYLLDADPMDGPSYYFGDVLANCEGFEEA